MLMSKDDWHDYGAEHAYELRKEHAMELFEPLLKVTGADTFWVDDNHWKYYDEPSDTEKALNARDIVNVSHMAGFTAGYVRDLIQEFILE